MKIIVIGAGAWGTAMAVSAARNPAGHQVVLLDVELAEALRRVGFIGYAETVYTMQQRVIGYKMGLMQHLPDQLPCVLHLKYSKEDSHHLIKGFLAEHKPDGLLCGTSDLCYQVLSVADDMRLNIPGQLKILTYDDNKWLDYLKYPVSVITQPTVEIGCHAVERILQLAGNRRLVKRTKTEILYDTQIIDRLK